MSDGTRAIEAADSNTQDTRRSLACWGVLTVAPLTHLRHCILWLRRIKRFINQADLIGVETETGLCSSRVVLRSGSEASFCAKKLVRKSAHERLNYPGGYVQWLCGLYVYV